MAEQSENNTFVRKLVIRKPKLTLAELQAAWDKASMPASKKPKDTQIISSARYALKMKYGLDTADDLPIKNDGEPNVSELIRLLFKRHPDMTESQCRHYLRSDGIEFTGPLFNAVKKGMEEKATQTNPPEAKPAAPVVPTAPTAASPDDNQHAGPRARFVAKKGRKPAAKPQPKPDDHKAQKYVEIENALDEVMLMARALEDSSLIEQVRSVRRTAIISAMKLV